MAKVIEGVFTRYEFTEDEAKQAVNFTELQRQFIQNEIAIAAESKIALTFDPLNPVSFAQQEAELSGKIGVLSYLLELSKVNATPQETTE